MSPMSKGITAREAPEVRHKAAAMAGLRRDKAQVVVCMGRQAEASRTQAEA